MQPTDDAPVGPDALQPPNGYWDGDRDHRSSGREDVHPTGDRDPRRDDMQNAFDFGNARRVAASRSASRAGDRREREADVADRDELDYRDGAGYRHEPSYRDESSYRDEPSYRGQAPRRRDESRPTAGLRVADYMDGDAGWPNRHADESPVIEYTDVIDEEELWGPRPKLLAAENGGRRTVVITGHGSDQLAVHRSGAADDSPVHARHGFNADRTAMWAVLLCVIVLLVAVTSH